MSFIRGAILLVGVGLTGAAHALPSSPNGLLLMDQSSAWGWNCPNGSAVLQEFTLQGLPLTIVDPMTWATVDFDDFTMIFLEDCQNDPTYAAWNARLDDLEDWVHAGGFLGVHATTDCVGVTVRPDIPGGTPAKDACFAYSADVVAEDHPVMAGVPVLVNAPGIEVAWDEYTSTGNPSDRVLMLAGDTGLPIYFERLMGHGAILYGGLTYSYYVQGCGQWTSDITTIVTNEVAWAATFPLCGDHDSDGDGVGDDCDVCDGGDDALDTDLDGVPDDCDPCPFLAWPDDVDEDGICDDVDDSDGDGIVDLHDLCPQVYDPDQTDSDGDGWGDACDDCPWSTQAGPRRIAWFVDADGDGQGVPGEPVLACERPQGRADNMKDCDDTNRYVRQGAPEVCDGLDNDCDGVVDFDGCVPDDPRTVAPAGAAPSGGGCHTAPGAAGWLLLLGAGLLVRRR